MPEVGFEEKFDLTSSRERIRSLALALYRVTDRIPGAEPLRAKLRKETLVFVSTVEKVSNGNMKKYPEFLSTVRTLAHYCDIARQQGWVAEENFAVLKNEFLNTQSLFEMELGEFDGMSELSHVVFNDRGSVSPAETDHSLSACGSADAETKPASPARIVESDTRQFASPTYAKASVGKQDTVPDGAAYLASADAGINPPNPQESVLSLEALIPRQKALLDFMVQNKKAKIGDLEKLEPDVTQRTLRRDMERLAKTGYVRKIGRTNRTLYKLVRTPQ